MEEFNSMDLVNNIIGLKINNGLKITMILLIENDSLTVGELNKLSNRTLTLDNYKKQMNEFIEKNIIEKTYKKFNSLNRVSFRLNKEVLNDYILEMES